MILDPNDAAAFLEGYKSVLLEIDRQSPGKQQLELVETLVAARSKYFADRSLLDSALAALSGKSPALSEEIVSAIRGLELKHWIYLRDTRSHSIFMDPDAEVAYGVVGLTNRIRDIIGGSGASIQTAITPYRGHYVCDGLISSVAWLGPNYKRSFNNDLARIRALGQFHKTPAG
jgi:hypothetical protein